MSTRQNAVAQQSSQEAAIEQTKSLSHVRARHVLLLGGLTAFGPISTDVYLPALPQVSQNLGTTMTLTQLTLTISIFGLSLGQVIAGPVSDARGRR